MLIICQPDVTATFTQRMTEKNVLHLVIVLLRQYPLTLSAAQFDLRGFTPAQADLIDDHAPLDVWPG